MRKLYLLEHKLLRNRIINKHKNKGLLSSILINTMIVLDKLTFVSEDKEISHCIDRIKTTEIIFNITKHS